ncbi:Chromo (CHRromatin Organization MOdifier) domain [Rhizoctonia solani]|uniref:Chromo (CHRromatin Organization MOdifier) domain n=1 Tax=Rhizoctonia solani TaxID=456999 RepID=A0A8H7I0C3_9AGAM|nr:Chromo (CHRromatin Organization MOdifier) domain [Rhizoctonia solani]
MSSVQKSPFKALHRWEPTLTPSNIPTDVPEADELAETMEAQWKEVEAALQQSKQQMIAGEHGSPTEFKVGEEVWLDAKNVNLKTLSPFLTKAPTSLPHLSTILSRTPTRSSSRASSTLAAHTPNLPWQPLPPTSSVEYGEASLERVTQLLLSLLGQVERLEREIAEIKEAGIETRTNVKNISQTVDVVKDGLKSLQLQGPRTPEGNQPKAVEETPRPIPKTKPIGSVSRGPFWSEPTREIPGLAQPTPRRAAPPQVPSPPPSPRLRSPIGAPAPPPPAPVAAYPARSPILPSNEYEGLRGAWAHPHLDQLGSHRAIIQTVEGFKLEFLAAFGNPDATRAAERKITTLTQSGTCADYITKFRTLAMELDWNNAALRGQFARGLHWEGDKYRSINYRFEELSKDPNFVSEEEQNRRRAAGACIKCGKMGHKFAECRTGWKATPIEDKGKPRKPPKLAKNLDPNREKTKDWNTRTLSFLHTPPEYVAIAEEEEANQNPLEGVPSKYHQYAKSATLKDWLRDELKAGKIRPSKSSISSPVMFVPKKDGSRRLVVDYRRLNNRTKKNVYPLPRPDDLMAQLRGAKVFTKLDLRWGYNNVRVKEGDKWKTAFRTNLLDVCVIIYLDDILIYSKDDATHTQHVHKVLRRLMENQLFCKASKCTFHVTSVEYLGIIVSDKGFSLDKLKIQAVQEWPTPSKVKEVQSFLGFANFLRRFVANFSHMAHPLHNLVKKDTIWKWGTKEQEAPYFLETDASGAALGSILSQQQEDGRLHLLGFLSESFKGAEQNYDTHDKELLAIIRSFEYWRIFLEGTAHPVTIFTDHRNLEYWKESRTFNRRHARWHLLLAGYNFQIVYRPGKHRPTMLPEPVFANVALVIPEKELQRQIESALDQDESLEEILQFLQNESKAPPSIKRAFKDYQMEAGLLFYQGRIVVPDVGTLRTDLLCIFHDSPLAGHPGRQRTLELVSRNYYWPGIRADTYWHVDSCETCQRIRKPKYATIPPQPLELPSRPWQHVSYDMIVDLPKDGSNDSILVIVDSFTKYVILVECSKKLKAPELADLFLRHVWKRYGMPQKTVSDQGRVFNNRFLKALYQRLGIDPHFSSAYHPQSDGQTERKDWVKWLPMAEFAYNNAVHSATGKSPFRALYGWEPSLTPSNLPMDVPEADELATQMEAQWQEIESALRQSKLRMTAGETGEPLEFEIGEEVWLDAKNVKLKT